MSAICGIVFMNNGNIPSEMTESMTNKLREYKYDSCGTWLGKGAFLGSIVKHDTPESIFEKLPYRDIQSNLVITADAIIDNREQLLNLFNIPSEKWEETTDSKLILEAYLKWGEDSPKYLLGDFTFAIWNEKKKELFCARDHVGKRTFYYNFSSNIFTFGTTIKTILNINGKTKLNDMWIAEFLASDDLVQEFGCNDTVYENVMQLLPAHTLKINCSGMTFKRYWNPNDIKTLKLKNNEEYEEAFREVLFEAVECRLRSKGNIGIMLSGGLDSGTVACIAAKKLSEEGKKIKGFSSVPMTEYRNILIDRYIPDETTYIDALAEKYNNIELNFCASEGINSYNSIENLLGILEQPYKIADNFFWVNELALKAAEAGCTTLLDGQFGNYTISFGDMNTYFFTKYRKGQVLSLLRQLYMYSKLHKMNYFEVLKYCIKLVIPQNIFDFYSKLRGHDIAIGKSISIANEKLTIDCNIDDRFQKLGLGKYYNMNKDFSQFKESLSEPFMYSQIGAAETKIALNNGITKRDPTRDKRVIEFCCSVPINQYIYKGQSRSLLRRAMKDILPDKVRLNYYSRGRQSADWIQRLRGDWDSIKNEISDLSEANNIKKYLDINMINNVLRELGHGPRDQDFEKVRIIITSIVFHKFIDLDESIL